MSADAYRAAHNADSFREEVRALHRHGLPVAVTEFGCCAYRGAADLGGRGFLVVDRDRDHGPWRLSLSTPSPTSTAENS